MGLPNIEVRPIAEVPGLHQPVHAHDGVAVNEG